MNEFRYFIVSPQEKLNGSIMAAFHISSLELMNLEENKKDTGYERYPKERILGSLVKVSLSFSYS